MEKYFISFVNDSKAQFLYPTNTFSSVVLATYPGIDEYMTRYMLECLTGIITGSDMKPENPYFEAMKARNFKGEGVIDSTTWIKKTNYPEVVGQEFEAHKCILLVRNPWDMMWQNFCQKIKDTKTTLEMAIIKTNELLFNSFVTTQAEKIHDFYSYWLDCPVPLFILKFEDLIFEPEKCLKSLFQFLFEVENLKGTQLENRILTFLKYNKYYTTFLEDFLSKYELGFGHYTLLQKNITFKILKEELKKMGYLHEGRYELIRHKETLEEEELKMLHEEINEGEREYQIKNQNAIDEIMSKKLVTKKFFVLPFIKINSKKASPKNDPFDL